jgi:amidophosphoribosyltransferase
VKHSCYYGIDTSQREELIAARKTVSEIQAFIGADSLSFLDEEEMLSVFGVQGKEHHGFCNACFTGNYPTEIYPLRSLER